MDNKLLNKFFLAECTPQERKEVLTWVNNPKNDVLLREWLLAHWDSFDASYQPEPELKQVWEQIQKHIDQQKPSTKVVKLQKRVWWQVAAVFVGLLGAGIAWFFTQNQPIETVYRTDFGQMLIIRLPDSSKVILNGNSVLRFRNHFETRQIREVWLEGEGFFSVVHTVSHQKFVVHTPNKLNVEVLGTEFTISQRKASTRVVLKEGKIQLRLTSAQESAPMLMQAGDLAEFDSKKRQITRKKVNHEVYDAWTNQSLVFENTPLSEVVHRLEETYNFQIDIEESLKDKRLTGKISIKNLDILFLAMESTFRLKITKHENKISIKQAP